MKLRILLLPLLLASCPAHAGDLAALLPEDTTFAIVGPDNAKLNKLGDHPIVKAFATPELKKLFAPLIDDYTTDEKRTDRIFKEETGLGTEEVNALFKGAFAYGLGVDFARIIDAAGKPNAKGQAMPSPFQFMDFAMLTTFEGSEEMAGKIAKAQGRAMSVSMAEARKGSEAGGKLAQFPEDFDATTEEYAGATLHLWKVRRGEKSTIETAGWALLDKVFIVGLSEGALRACVDRAAKGGRSLADSPRYRGFVTHAGNGDISIYVDLRAVMGQILKAAAAKVRPGMLPVDPVKALEAIGVDKFDALYGTLNFKEAVAEGEIGVTFDQKPVLLDLVAIDGPGAAPDFIPGDADSGSYGTLHAGRLLPAIEKIIGAAMPMLSEMLSSQIAALKKKSGVDLQNDLLSNMGPNTWSATAPGPASLVKKTAADGDDTNAGDSQVIGLQLKDRKAFDLALGSLINAAVPGKALFEESEYQGFTIKRFKESPMPVAFLTTDEWLIISTGPQSLCERILSRMKSGATDGLFTQPHVRAATAGLPDGGHGTGYMDLGGLLNGFLPLLSDLDEAPGIGEILDLDEVPEKVNVPLDLGSRQFMDEHSLRVRIRVTQKAK